MNIMLFNLMTLLTNYKYELLVGHNQVGKHIAFILLKIIVQLNRTAVSCCCWQLVM